MTFAFPAELAYHSIPTTRVEIRVIDHLNGAGPKLEARLQREWTFAQLACRGDGTHIVCMVLTGTACSDVGKSFRSAYEE